MTAERTRSDLILTTVTGALALFGTLMVYSASAMHSHRETAGASQFTYFYKQLAFTLIGLAAMFLVARVDYRKLSESDLRFRPWHLDC
jgi:cell division protein FtsW (lipid II flippase)